MLDTVNRKRAGSVTDDSPTTKTARLQGPLPDREVEPARGQISDDARLRM